MEVYVKMILLYPMGEQDNFLTTMAATPSAFDGIPAQYKATVYTPELKRITDVKEDGDFDKFGGMPSVEPGFVYPVCKGCKHPLQFFFQLTSPITGVTMQMFHCIHSRICDASTDDQPYLRCISYAVARAAHLDAGTRERFTKAAYANTDDDETYHAKWLSQGYPATTPYQCFRVAAWVAKRELRNPESGKPSVRVLRDIFTPGKGRGPIAPTGMPSFAPILPLPDTCGLDGKEIESLMDEYDQLADEVRVNGLKWGGSGDSTQGIDYAEYALHFGDTHYLPYMWGDCGFFHISESLKVASDCC